MSDVLERICADKAAHVAARKRATPLGVLEARAAAVGSPRGFHAALAAAAADGFGLICEIKKASPSKGLICKDFDPPALARAYRAGGATCLSVLTDEPYFQGRDADLTAARAAAGLPVLRKDFTLEPYQVFEARAIGADCVLLILAALDDATAAALERAALALGMDVLIEVHDAAELDRARKLESPLIGVNNRDLKTLTVDLGVTEELAERMPRGRLLISESGLHGADDLARMARAGAHCFLVGESLLRQPDVAAATRELLAAPVARRASA